MEKKQQVIRWLDDHKEDLLQLLQKLVQIPSVTGSEYDVQMAVKAYAEEAGFSVRAQAFDEEGKRPNLLITLKGKGCSGKTLMLDAHADTVPVAPHENWEHDPFSADFDGTWIHGRGTTDDKWGIATSLITMRALKECGVELEGDMQLLASVGEETDVNHRRKYGAGAMIRTVEKLPDLCIVCEESGKTVGTEAPRNLKFTLKVKGKAVHTCVRRNCVFPQPNGISSGNVLGVDGLQKAMLIIDALYRLERDLSVNYRQGGLLGTGGAADAPRNSIGACTINPMKIEGGGPNSLIENVTVSYSAHFASGYTTGEVMELIQDTVKNTAMTDLWLRNNLPEVEFLAVNDGFYTDAQDPVVDVVRQAHGQIYGKPAIAQAWVAGCDADAMPGGIPCVVYGPTGRWAHAANEASKLDDLLETAKVYAMTAMDFCK